MLVIAVPDELVADEVASRLERVFGFAAASVCLRCERDVERIADVAMVAFARAQPRDLRRARAAPRQVVPAHVAGARAPDRRRDPGAHRAAGRPQPARTSSCASSSTRDGRLRARARARGRGRAAGRHERPRGRAAVGRHRLAGRVAARDEARARGRVPALQRRAVPRPDRDHEGAGAGAGAERLPGAAARRDVGRAVRQPAADAVGGLAGVAPDRALPAPDGAHRLRARASGCARRRS